MDVTKIDNVVVDGVNTSDYPDFCDAFIESADLDGVKMTDKQLDDLNDNYTDFVYDSVMKSIT